MSGGAGVGLEVQLRAAEAMYKMGRLFSQEALALIQTHQVLLKMLASTKEAAECKCRQ